LLRDVGDSRYFIFIRIKYYEKYQGLIKHQFIQPSCFYMVKILLLICTFLALLINFIIEIG